MKVHINRANDWSVGVLSHNVITPVGIPAPPSVSVEMFAPQKYTGYFLNKAKLTRKVKHRGSTLVQGGHEVGPMILDITPLVIANWYYAIMWPFSSRKITFSSSTVNFESEPAGCAQTLGLPPLPMMTCGDPISAPTALVFTNILRNTKVGMTNLDLVAGLVEIAISIGLDLIFGKIADLLPVKPKIDVGEGIQKTVRQLLLKELKDKLNPVSLEGVKAVLGGSGGLSSDAIKGKKDKTFQIGLGHPLLEGGIGYTWGEKKGFKWEVNILGHFFDSEGKRARFGKPL
jgi:hypothetical protein